MHIYIHPSLTFLLYPREFTKSRGNFLKRLLSNAHLKAAVVKKTMAKMAMKLGTSTYI